MRSREYAGLAARQRALLALYTCAYYGCIVTALTAAGVVLAAPPGGIPRWQGVLLLLLVCAHSAALVARDVVAGVRGEDEHWRAHVALDVGLLRVGALSWRLASDDAWGEDALSRAPGAGGGALSLMHAIEAAAVYSALPAVSLLAYALAAASAARAPPTPPLVALAASAAAAYALAVLGLVRRLERSGAATPRLRRSITAGRDAVPAAIALDVAANAASLALSAAWLGPVALAARVVAGGVARAILLPAARSVPASVQEAWLNVAALVGVAARPPGHVAGARPWPSDAHRAQLRLLLVLTGAAFGIVPCIVVTVPGTQAAIAAAIAAAGGGGAAAGLLGVCSVDAALAAAPSGVCSGGGAEAALGTVIVLWALRLLAFATLEAHYGAPAPTLSAHAPGEPQGGAGDGGHALRRAALAAFEGGAGTADVLALAEAAALLGPAIDNDCDGAGNTLLHSVAAAAVRATAPLPIVAAALGATIDHCACAAAGGVPPQNDAGESPLHAALRACGGVAGTDGVAGEVGGGVSADVVALLAVRLPRCATMRDAEGVYPLHAAVRCWRALSPHVFEVLIAAYPRVRAREAGICSRLPAAAAAAAPLARLQPPRAARMSTPRVRRRLR